MTTGLVERALSAWRHSGLARDGCGLACIQAAQAGYVAFARCPAAASLLLFLSRHPHPSTTNYHRHRYLARSPIERSSDRFFLFDGVIPWFLGSLDIFKSDLEEEEKKKAERGARRGCCRSAHRAQPPSTPLDIHRIDVDEPFI